MGTKTKMTLLYSPSQYHRQIFLVIKENKAISHHEMIKGIAVGNLFQCEVWIKDIAYLQQILDSP